MIKVKEGKFYYKLITEKTEDYPINLINFLTAKGITETELKKLEMLNFTTDVETSTSINHARFELNIKVKGSDVVLLFGCQMDSGQFSDFVSGHLD